MCGEKDGKVQKVVIQVDGKMVARHRLCLMCRAAMTIRMFTKEKRH